MVYYAIEPPEPWGNIRGKPYITVSAKGISNGLSDIENDGADFGPDTPGTQTSGIQEAINYLPQSTNDYSGSGGGKIVLRSGLYQIASQIVIPANYAYYLILEGEGMGTTELRWVSQSVPQYGMITQTNFGNFNSPLPLNIVIIDMMLSAPASYPMYLLYLSPNNIIMNRVAFSSIEMLTQSATGSGYTFDFNTPPTTKPSLQGAYIASGNGNKQSFRECVFQGLANGIYFYETYHVHVTRSMFAFTGRYQINGTYYNGTGLSGMYTQYGPAIIWDGGTGTFGRFVIEKNHFFNDYTDLLIVNTSFNGKAIIRGNLFDGSTYNLIISSQSNSVELRENTFTIGGSLLNNGIYSIDTSTGSLSTTVNNVGMINNTFNINTSSTNNFNYPSITTPSVPASGTAQQNTYLFPVEVYLNGGTVTQVTRTAGRTNYTVFSSSSGVALAGLTVRLEPADSITITYTAAPTWVWAPA